MRKYSGVLALVAGLVLTGAPSLQVVAKEAPTPIVAVGPQYDTTHVYVAPGDVDHFVASFLGTFGGQSTKQGIFVFFYLALHDRHPTSS